MIMLADAGSLSAGRRETSSHGNRLSMHSLISTSFDPESNKEERNSLSIANE